MYSAMSGLFKINSQQKKEFHFKPQATWSVMQVVEPLVSQSRKVKLVQTGYPIIAE